MSFLRADFQKAVRMPQLIPPPPYSLPPPPFRVGAMETNADRCSNSDVRRKHMKSCIVRKSKGLEMPNSIPPGKKIRACDQCASTKRACDSSWPCSVCREKSKPCTYQRLECDPLGRPNSFRLDLETRGHMDESFPNPGEPWAAPAVTPWTLSASNWVLGLEEDFETPTELDILADFD